MPGRYRLEQEIGRGAWGVVYRALDTVLGIEIAIKVLEPHAMPTATGLERFKRELLLARSLAHPGVCRVFDLHEHDGTYFISMEHIQGTSLERLLVSEGKLTPGRAVDLVRELCSAIAAAHDAGIAHRDLKPSNIIVRPNDKPSIVDFGLATAPELQRLTAPGFTVATLRYSAPEVLRGQAATPQVDQYSLGVILYRCLTGRFPYDVDDPVALLHAHESSRAVPPHTLDDSISVELGDVVMRAIATTPADRYSNVREFNRALDAAAPERTDVTAIQLDDTAERPAPWDRDIDTLVHKVLASPGYSTLQQHKELPLTTVLFSDIVGITSYFDRFGDVAGMRRLQTHNMLLFPVIEAHNGTVVKTIGDAIMATFERAEDAAQAAVHMQEALAAHNDNLSSEEQGIHVRIGLHSGQALVHEADVFGNTVNVAARICSLARGNEILVSSATHDGLAESARRASFHSNAELKGKAGTFTLFAVHWSQEATVVTRDLVTQGSAASVASAGRARRSAVLAAAAAGAAIIVGVAASIATRDAPNEGARAATTPVAQPVTETVTPVAPAAPRAKEEPTLEPRTAPQPQVSETPARTTAAKTRSTSQAQRNNPLREEVQQLTAKLEAARRSKGIIAGDLPELERTQQAVKQALQGSQWEAARSLAGRALALIESTSVDRRFVAEKLARFNARYDSITDESRRSRLAPIASAALQAFSARDYEATNRHLNQGFAVLER